MHALRPLPDDEDIWPNNGLSVAKTAFRPSADFRQSRLAAAISGVCRTQGLGRPLQRPERPQVGGRGEKRHDHDLIVRLCSLVPDLAAPLLRSRLPSLTPSALFSIVAATGEAHHRLVAARSDLDGRVIKALIGRNAPEVLLTLADNMALAFDDADQHALAKAAETNERLRAALLSRPDLVAARTHLDPPDWLSHNNLKLLTLLRSGDGRAFTSEAGRRLRLDGENLHARMAGESAVPLALALRALSLDRAVFSGAFHDWRAAHGGYAMLNDAHRRMVLSVFAMTPADARNRLIALAA